jgi:hypothetical protein
MFQLFISLDLPCDVVDEQGADGAAVVGTGDGAEVLLACGVPDLQFDGLVANGDGLGAELHPDGDVVRGPRLVLDELQHDAGLAHA